MEVPSGPLSGLRVLDLSRVLAGPWASQLLGDLGAEPVGSTPQQFEAFVKNEVQKWHGVADKTGMRAEE